MLLEHKCRMHTGRTEEMPPGHAPGCRTADFRLLDGYRHVIFVHKRTLTVYLYIV